MGDTALTEEEINEVQQSWDMMARSTGGLREAGLILYRQLFTSQPHHVKSFEKFKKYKDFEDIMKSPEMKAHSYSTVREITLVIANLKHPGIAEQMTQSLGFAHRQFDTPPQQLMEFKSVFLGEFIPEQMADKATPNTFRAWDKFMTFFMNSMKNGLELDVDPTTKKNNNRNAGADRNKNKIRDKGDDVNVIKDNTLLKAPANTNEDFPSSEDIMKESNSIVRSPTNYSKTNRKKCGCCCC